MSRLPIRIVALLAEASGLELLRQVLLPRQDIEIAAVFTHLRRRTGEGRGQRGEIGAFRTACRDAGVALVFADGPEAEDVGPLLPISELDLLIRLGWECVVDAAALGRFRLGCVDLEPADAAARAHAAIDAVLAAQRATA